MGNRKFNLSLIALILTTTAFLACQFFPGLIGVYTTLISAILGILTIYSGANVAQDHIFTKNSKPEEETSQQPPEQ